MAYITKNEVVKIRSLLKNAFPAKDGWKLSVRGGNTSSLNVTFLQGPVAFETYDSDRPWAELNPAASASNHFSVNHHYIDDRFPEETAKLLKVAKEIMSLNHWDESDIQSDYFNCAYYMNLSVGSWDKPYQVI